MGLRILRYRTSSAGHAWALVEGEAARPIDAAFETTGALLERGIGPLREGALRLGAPRPLVDLELLSPVTSPCRIIAQAMNYPAHVREVGMRVESRSSNVLFTKASASLCSARDPIVRPPHVRLLDYELELGLVIGARVRGPRSFDEATLADVIGALVVANDVSARDVQVPEGQFYKGKSYPAFTPCGPLLFVPEPRELARWPELQLTLRVNGEVRQNALAGEMIHRPAATLTEITSFEHLDPGDLILTGTPGGVALQPPNKPLRALGELLPESTRWKLFVNAQAKRRAYLRPGDRVHATIRTPDGVLDLGAQENLVR